MEAVEVLSALCFFFFFCSSSLFCEIIIKSVEGLYFPLETLAAKDIQYASVFSTAIVYYVQT